MLSFLFWLQNWKENFHVNVLIWFLTGYCNCCHGSHPGVAWLQLVQTQDLLEPLLDYHSCFYYCIGTLQGGYKQRIDGFATQPPSFGALPKVCIFKSLFFFFLFRFLSVMLLFFSNKEYIVQKIVAFNKSWFCRYFSTETLACLGGVGGVVFHC